MLICIAFIHTYVLLRFRKGSTNCSGINKGRVRLCRSKSTHSSVILAVFLHSAYLFIHGGSALRCTLHLLFPSLLDIAYLPSTYTNVNIIESSIFQILSRSLVSFRFPRRRWFLRLSITSRAAFGRKLEAAKYFLLWLVHVSKSKCVRPSACTRDCNNFLPKAKISPMQMCRLIRLTRGFRNRLNKGW